MTSWRQPGDFGWLIVWLAPIFPLAQKTNSRLKEARKLRFEVPEYSRVWAGLGCSEHDELLAGGAPCGSSAGRRVHRPTGAYGTCSPLRHRSLHAKCSPVRSAMTPESGKPAPLLCRCAWNRGSKPMLAPPPSSEVAEDFSAVRRNPSFSF